MPQEITTMVSVLELRPLLYRDWDTELKQKCTHSSSNSSHTTTTVKLTQRREEDIAVGVEDISQRLDGMYQSLLSTTCNVSQREMGPFGGRRDDTIAQWKKHNWWKKKQVVKAAKRRLLHYQLYWP